MFLGSNKRALIVWNAGLGKWRVARLLYFAALAWTVDLVLEPLQCDYQRSLTLALGYLRLPFCNPPKAYWSAGLVLLRTWLVHESRAPQLPSGARYHAHQDCESLKA